MRYTLLAALCWQREREITDTLVELLIHIAHRVGVRAEEKVEIELMKYVKKVMGKAKLLYKLAKAAKGHPDGLVRNVIYPVVSETTLDDLIREAESGENHEHQGKVGGAGLLQSPLPPHRTRAAGGAVLPVQQRTAPPCDGRTGPS